MFMFWWTPHFLITKSGISICLCISLWDQCVLLQTCRHLAYPLPCKIFTILIFPSDFSAEPEAPEESPYKQKKLFFISINHQINCTCGIQKFYGMLLPVLSAPNSLGFVESSQDPGERREGIILHPVWGLHSMLNNCTSSEEGERGYCKPGHSLKKKGNILWKEKFVTI